jgi:hypothetical protein
MEKYGNTGTEAITELKNDIKRFGFTDTLLSEFDFTVINPDVYKLKYKILLREFLYFDNGILNDIYGIYQQKDSETASAFTFDSLNS